MEQSQWAQASKHFEGSGVEFGVDLSVTWAHLQSLRTKCLTHLAAILELVSQGALWPAQRRFENAKLGTPACPRCGAESETLYHQFWARNAHVLPGEEVI